MAPRRRGPLGEMARFFSRQKKGSEPAWDPDVEPLMRILIGKKGIKTKTASEVGRKKVDYFRGRDFKKFVLSSEDLLKKKCAGALRVALDGKVPTTDKDVERLGAELIMKQFCYKAQYKPLNQASNRADDGSEKKKKWPDRLGRMQNQSFDCEGFYVITYEGGSGLQHFLLALIIVGVLLACMFPVWPMWAKIGIWYLSVIFLSLYFGVLILRMIIYTLFWIVGFDFWIFPNLNDEYCGFLDSFQPIYSWEKRKDDLLMLLVRFGSLAIVAVAVEQISQTTSLADVGEFVTSTYIDVIDWGVEKLIALPGSERQALPSLESIQADTAMLENCTNCSLNGSNETNGGADSGDSETGGGQADADDDDSGADTVEAS